MTSTYELNGGVQKFKVLDYEVFKIWIQEAKYYLIDSK
jgi:hypothetical protein